MEKNLTFDEHELYNQVFEEIENEEHSFVVRVAVPGLSLEGLAGIKKEEDLAPVADVHGGKSGTNAVTRAYGAVILQEVLDTILSDEYTAGAYEMLKDIIKDETKIEFGEETKDDPTINPKG